MIKFHSFTCSSQSPLNLLSHPTVLKFNPFSLFSSNIREADQTIEGSVKYIEPRDRLQTVSGQIRDIHI